MGGTSTPPFTHDMSPPDSDLFPKLKPPLNRKHFRSTEKASSEVTEVIRPTKKKVH
jgi:hypothetical protein